MKNTHGEVLLLEALVCKFTNIFHIFKIVQMQPNWATHHSYLALFMDTMNAREKTIKTCKKFVLRINPWDVYYVSAGIFKTLFSTT